MKDRQVVRVKEFRKMGKRGDKWTKCGGVSRPLRVNLSSIINPYLSAFPGKPLSSKKCTLAKKNVCQVKSYMQGKPVKATSIK